MFDAMAFSAGTTFFRSKFLPSVGLIVIQLFRQGATVFPGQPTTGEGRVGEEGLENCNKYYFIFILFFMPVVGYKDTIKLVITRVSLVLK